MPRVDAVSPWTFSTLSLKPPHSPVGLSPEQEGKIPQYVEALTTARDSTVPSPKFSQYFVKEGVVSSSYKGAVPAGNVEYGICQALHGEESAVAAHRSKLSSLELSNNPRDIVLGLIAGNPGNVPAPCGNCRDIMIDGFGGTDFEIVSGTADGGAAVVLPMHMFTFENPAKVDTTTSQLKAIVSETLREGEILTNDAYSPKDVNPERKYFAAIVKDGEIFFGGRDVMVDYHPIYALRDAIRQARRENNSAPITSIVIVAEDPNVNMPHVMYKDRQHLLEYNFQVEAVNDEENDPPVFLVSHDGKGKITNVWQTSVKEWLPFAFNPRNFGPEFVQFFGDFHKNRVG